LNVNGLAFGGGCELVEATHIALAAEKSSFSKAEINIEIIPTFGGTQRLPRNVGRKAAIELILTGRTFDATEAARLGLINRVVPGIDLLEEAVKLADTLATKLPLTLAAALAAIHRGMDGSIIGVLPSSWNFQRRNQNARSTHPGEGRIAQSLRGFPDLYRKCDRSSVSASCILRELDELVHHAMRRLARPEKEN
jgi:enoyl-CoA hydratase/carnithine racemase